MYNKVILIFLMIVLPLNMFSQEEEQIDYEAFDITKVGQQVPDFSFETIDGKSFEMSQLKGKTVLLVFFATWCGPCMKELPRIQEEIYNKYHSDQFMVIAFGRNHSMDEIKKFNEAKGFSFLLAPDPDRNIYSKFFEQYIPRNVLVDKTGKIVYQRTGYDEEDAKQLKGLIAKELN
ncbi:TlpA family protein disulfide reductase [Plebeiibacterium sediminum]|uniref:TlpA family protein disulfide reductase n=1 Tax=Plebeiibacterium sediminum TaxID=2992112 RepID=A0AAE3SGM3_9BACT|nr:TlpA disulfide reductase family protein [Plebeiobacterium sediminum]MCW3787443.1 TlpA family protein disulfide reductase [Plebeiobacterium sediminum]